MSNKQQQAYTLLTAAANGTGSAVPGFFTDKASLYVSGTFGGATVTLEASPDDGTTWVPVNGVSVTAATVLTIDLVATQVRGVVTGGTAEAVDAQIIRN